MLDYETFAEVAKELTSGTGVSAVFGGVGPTTFDGSLAAVRPGMVVLHRAARGAVPLVDSLRLAAAGSVFLTRPTVVHYTATVAESRGRADDVFSRLGSGSLSIATPTSFDLQRARRPFPGESLRSRQGDAHGSFADDHC